jgi:hypothetical protein
VLQPGDNAFAQRAAGREKKLQFLLEADTGTMPHARIALKIKAYAAYHEQQRHLLKFGMNYFQVVIVTQTRERAESLKIEFHASVSAPQRRAYHFIPLDELAPDALLAQTPAAASPRSVEALRPQRPLQAVRLPLVPTLGRASAESLGCHIDRCLTAVLFGPVLNVNGSPSRDNQKRT